MPVTAPSPSAAADLIGASAIRKASLRIMPLIAIGYGIAYMDRVNISFAALQMNRDLHFSATVYGFGAGLFFLSYAACEIPSNLALYKIGARRWLARIMITWGIIAMAMLFVRTPTQFYVARFFLGMAEAGFFPGIIYYLSQWFPANLRARTVSRFYISLPLSIVLMGAIAGVLLNLNGHLGLAGWQWLFLVEGCPAVLLGLVYLKFLPSTPAEAKWLTEPERDWLVETIASDGAAVAGKSHSIAAAFRDPRVWQMGTFMMLMLLSAYAYTFSSPDIVQLSTHWSTSNVGFTISAMSLLGAVAMVAGAIHSDRTGERYFHVIVPGLVSAVAFLVCGLSNRPIFILPALTVVFCSFCVMQGPLWALPGTFFTGRSAAAGIAAMNMVGILGGFLGPYMMGIAKDLTGTYQRGLSLASIVWVIACLLMFFVYKESQRKA